MSMCAPKELIDGINAKLKLIQTVAPLLGMVQVTVLAKLLEIVLNTIPAEPLVTAAQLAGGEEHVPGGPIPDPEKEM